MDGSFRPSPESGRALAGRQKPFDQRQALRGGPRSGAEPLHGTDAVSGAVDDVGHGDRVTYRNPGSVQQFQRRVAHHVGEEFPHTARGHQRRGALSDHFVGHERAVEQFRFLVQQPPEVPDAPFAEYPDRVAVAHDARASLGEERVLSARSVDEGRKGVMFAGALTLATLFIIVFPGVIARHLFPGIEKPDMIYPTMVLRLLPTGLLGIMLSALLAALTSTLSAILNSTSTLFTMDFYAKIDKRADERKLVRVGKLASLVIIVIAALWAPQIGRFGSLLKYYQEMLSYIAPPVVAAFLMGVFSRRANGRGAFAGLIAGLVVAAAMLLWRTEIFGGMHFLLIVPFLLVFSLSVIWAVSRTAPAPRPDKLIDTTFSAADFRAETRSLAEISWWRNYRVWGGVLLVLCMLILIIFR